MAGFYASFFNPQSSYGKSKKDPTWQDDRLNVSYGYGEQNRDASFTRRLAGMGLGGVDARSNLARGFFNRLEEGYKAAKMTNMDLDWQKYLAGTDIDTMVTNASPAMRDEQYGKFAPRVRWAQRPF